MQSSCNGLPIERKLQFKLGTSKARRDVGLKQQTSQSNNIQQFCMLLPSHG